MTAPEVIYCVRRTDGDEIGGEYRWLVVDGPDDWHPAELDAEHLEERADYELCRHTIEVVGTRTLGPDPTCDTWVGEVRPAKAWVELVARTDGTDRTWPARDAAIARYDTAEAAYAVLEQLPVEVVVAMPYGGPSQIITVERSSIEVVERELPERVPPCDRCGRRRDRHEEPAR